MKRRRTTTFIDPDQAHRIRWRGVMLAPGCFRGFCSRCGAHMIEGTKAEAVKMTLVCGYCREDAAIAEEVRQVMAENARRTTGTYGPIDDESPWQSNAIREMEQ